MSGSLISNQAAVQNKPPRLTNFDMLQRKQAAEFEKNFQRQLSLYKQSKGSNENEETVSDNRGDKLDKYLMQKYNREVADPEDDLKMLHKAITIDKEDINTRNHQPPQGERDTPE